MVRFPINLLNCRKVCRAIYKFDLIVIFAEFDDGLKYRVGAEVPKSDRQSFFRLSCTAYTNADCRTNTQADFFLKKQAPLFETMLCYGRSSET